MKKRIMALVCCFMLFMSPAAVMAQEEASAAEDTKEVTFYLVRHGETLFNKKELAQGWCDSPLTQAGQDQAKAVAEGLKDIDFVAAYSSTSERAMDTAHAIIDERGLPLNLSKDLREINFGLMEGESGLALWAPDFGTRMSEGWVEFGGESPAMATERLMNAMNEIAAANSEEGGNVLVASHGLSITFIAMAVDQQKAYEYMAKIGGGLSNCAVTIVTYSDGTFTLEDMGNTTYRDSGAEALGLSW